MKKFIKWLSITLAALLVLAVAFTGIFVVLPLSRSVKNLKEKQEDAASVSQPAQTADVTQAAPAAETTTADSAAPPAETTAVAPAREETPNEYDIYRTGHFYVKGTVTDNEGTTNPMEMAITDGSVFILTAASGVQMGVMVGGGKTYLVSPENRAYIELNSTIMSILGVDPAKLALPTSFNFSDMSPLSEAVEINESTLNGVACTDYVFRSSSGKKSCVYMDGTRLLQTDMFNKDGSLYNRMTFESVSAEIPSDRKAPPTYYEKKSLLGFVSMLGKSLSE